MKRKTLINCLLILIFTLSPLGALPPAAAAPQACAAGPHEGTLLGDETWCAGDNPHVMNHTVIVPAGRTLTLEPGTVVKGADSITDLRIEGHLDAIGTSEQPITITSFLDSGPDQWAGLYFNGGTGNLEYATVRYGGTLSPYTGRPGNVILRNVQSAAVHIHHSRILDVGNLAGNTVHGLFVENSHLELTDTLFSGNAVQSGVGIENQGYPMNVIGASSVVTMTGNTFTGNLQDRVLLAQDAMTANSQVILSRQEALEGYELINGYVIPAGMTLAVEPGVTLMSRWGTGIQILGRLEALGTATAPITFTSATNTGPAEWEGLYFKGGAGRLDHVVAHYGGSGLIYPRANISLRNVAAPGVQISNSLIAAADSPGNSPAGVQVENSVAVIADTIVADNGSESTAAGVRILGANSQVRWTNVAIVRTGLPGGGKGVRLEEGAQLVACHTTLAENREEGISVSGATAQFTNTILAQNSVGVRVENSGTVTLTHTLWDRNTTPVIGTIQDSGHFEGLAGLALDGYHLTRYSAAIGNGLLTGAALDLDGEARPQPAGTQPDLGVDEYPVSPLEVFSADQVALTPQWVFTTDPVNGEAVSELHQDYLIRFFYGSPLASPPAFDLSIQAALPGEVNYVSDTHVPQMSLAQSGHNLDWHLIQPFQKGVAGEIMLHTTGVPQAGQILTSFVTVTANSEAYRLQTSVTVPVLPPTLLAPGNGEYCRHTGGAVSLHGLAQPAVEVRAYENGSLVASQVVTSGEFTLNYNSIHAGVDGQTALEVRACAQVGAQPCSAPTTVKLKAAQSFWCPQESILEGTPATGPLAGQHLVYGFRNAAGEFSSQDWRIPGVLGFADTDLMLVTGYCPGTTTPPNEVWAVADGVRYDPQPGGGPVYHIDITGSAHALTLAANCGETSGVILIDPDGYVFDSTQGFDSADPGAHAVAGATVTAYEYIPAMESWRPWPAHLYNHQINPQTVSASGYFAFFTPPGRYYLQVTGPDGYQSWRSPVIEVVNEIVHVNVPLMPVPWPAAQLIQVSPTGISRPQVRIHVGQAILWAMDSSSVGPQDYIDLSENPIQRILSALDPLTNPLGFDSGRLIPGEGFFYRFTQPGTYAYTDGYGHSGEIVVDTARIFLPVILP